MSLLRRRRWHFNVWDLLKLQVILSPLFLALAYWDYQPRAYQFDPFTALAWFLVPPCLYVFLLVTFRLRSAVPHSYVFAGIRQGIFFGLLFGGLSWGPFGIPAILRALFEFCKLIGLAVRRNLPMSGTMIVECASETLAKVGIITGLLLVHYAVVGAASGVLAAVTMQWITCVRKKKPV